MVLLPFDHAVVKLRIAISPWFAMPGIAVITMLAAAVGGSRASLKVKETVRALLTVAPSAGVEAITLVCASAVAGKATGDAAIARAANSDAIFMSTDLSC